jgi:hypothetical protein
MSQRLQAAMLDISSSSLNKSYQQQQQQQQLHASKLSLHTLDFGAVRSEPGRAPRVDLEEEGGMGSGHAELGSSSCSPSAVSCHVGCTQRQLDHEQQHHHKHQQQQQHHLPLLCPHPLMPSLLDKVRVASSSSNQAVLNSYAPMQQQSKLKPKERFKGAPATNRSCRQPTSPLPQVL